MKYNPLGLALAPSGDVEGINTAVDPDGYFVHRARQLDVGMRAGRRPEETSGV